jgi:ring-1,2-phenylacetyl-CoA epoxidase subunit PaaD
MGIFQDTIKSVSLNTDVLWALLDEVKDPEIPSVSVVEMGMIRDIVVDASQVIVKLAPTFSGCPALELIRASIKEKLEAAGAATVQVPLDLSTPWSTDWISPVGRQKLTDAGIAPPLQHHGLIEISLLQPVTCPYCGSHDTRSTNSFGPTLCRAIYTCNHCRQPFEQFKPL